MTEERIDSNFASPMRKVDSPSVAIDGRIGGVSRVRDPMLSHGLLALYRG